MVKHITPWLEAYLDGELPDMQTQQVEQHLAECNLCQAELMQSRKLSSLLQETVPAPEFLPVDRFVANLTIMLPSEQVQPRSSKAFEIGWWLIPVGVLAAWLVFQITTSLSSALISLTQADLLGSGLTWLQGNPSQARWIAWVMDLFGRQIGDTGNFILSVINDLSLFVAGLERRLFWQAFFAMLYLGWLASWWMRQSNGTFVQVRQRILDV